MLLAKASLITLKTLLPFIGLTQNVCPKRQQIFTSSFHSLLYLIFIKISNLLTYIMLLRLAPMCNFKLHVHLYMCISYLNSLVMPCSTGTFIKALDSHRWNHCVVESGGCQICITSHPQWKQISLSRRRNKKLLTNGSSLFFSIANYFKISILDIVCKYSKLADASKDKSQFLNQHTKIFYIKIGIEKLNTGLHSIYSIHCHQQSVLTIS